MNDAVFHRPNRQVLFHGGVGGVGDDLTHRLAAANHRHTYVLHLGNNVSAVLADIEFLFHFHSPFPFVFFLK
jgi:hypothetical protein